MRGPDGKMAKVFVYSSPDSFVPKDHPLRPIRAMVDQALADLCPDFTKMYSHTGRPGVPPEKLLKSLGMGCLRRSRWRSARKRRCDALGYDYRGQLSTRTGGTLLVSQIGTFSNVA